MACVGSQVITGTTFLHWANVAHKDEGSSSKHRPSVHEVISEVMGFLISSDWVLGEAEALNIHVSEAQVRHQFDRIRAHQFPRPKEFKKFLKQTGQTVADLLLRVRLNMLSGLIQNRIAVGHRGARATQRALSRFIQTFRRKWTAQTYCDQGHAVPDCGHVQASL